MISVEMESRKTKKVATEVAQLKAKVLQPSWRLQKQTKPNHPPTELTCNPSQCATFVTSKSLDGARIPSSVCVGCALDPDDAPC